jgi:hypothetical protein
MDTGRIETGKYSNTRGERDQRERERDRERSERER